MKLTPCVSLLVCALGLGVHLSASAQSFDAATLTELQWGAADPLNWSILSVGGSTVTINNESVVRDFDPDGNLFDGRSVGIQGAGKLQMSGNGSISGSALLGSGSKIGITSSNIISGGISGTNLSGDPKNVPLFVMSKDSLLDQAAADAFSFSALYAGLGATSSVSAITDSLTLTGNSGLNVLNLSKLELGGGEVLTIDGGGIDSFFVVNVFGDLKLNSGVIDLVGGLTYDEVLFNVIGGDVSFSGGGNASQLEGTVMALDGQIAISPGLIEGTLIGNNITLTSGADMETVVVPEPATSVFIAAALAMFGFRRRRRAG